jgi:hypothetical protein
VRNPLIKAEANDFSLIGPCSSSVDLSKNKKREQGADDGERLIPAYPQFCSKASKEPV